MFVECFSNNGYKYLRLVKSERFTNDDGVRKVRKRTVYNIGPLHKFDDGQPDFVNRLKDSWKRNNPIIDCLKPFVPSENAPINFKHNIQIQDGDEHCFGNPKLFSNVIIEKCLQDIGLTSFVSRYKQFTNYKFDLLGYIRLLIYGRILNPSSKISTVNQNNDYYKPIIKDVYEYNVYDTLDFIYNYKNQILNSINNSVTKKFNRDTSVIYYDVTNFFFEIDNPDDDTINDKDEVISKGLRKSGVSKENRRDPIVQMGLFIDNNGLPISIDTFSGNTLDHQTFITSIESTDEYKLPRYILVADRGIHNGHNLGYLTNRNNGYIVSKSIKKSRKKDKEWIFNEDGYVYQGKDFKLKSKIVKRTITTPEGKVMMNEKVVVYWSKKFYDKQKNENKSFFDFIEKLKKNPSSFKITKTQNKLIKKYLKDDVVNIKTGEVINSKDLISFIDEEKIKRFENELGYYQIVTSELDMDNNEVIDTYHGLSRIEDQFRTMKSTIDTRPIYLSKPERIEAHLLICMISLLIIRILQNKIVEYKKEVLNEKCITTWSNGMSGERLQKALNKFTVDGLNEELYRFNNIEDDDLNLILNAISLKIEKKLYRKGELRGIKSKITI